ncbi:MAG: peptidase S41, partial [Duncaniella sp.]|nr:peptidase S41 [Duncaniella sp.]
VNICVGDVIGVKLPYTGFKAMIPCRIFYEYGAKEGDEIHGTKPHIPTKADDALDYAIKII